LAANNSLIRIDGTHAIEKLAAFRIPGDPTVVVRLGDRNVVCGDSFLAAYRAESNEPLWSIKLANSTYVGLSSPTYASPTYGAPDPLVMPPGFFFGKLSAFHRAGGTLFALLDDRALLAFDVQRGTLRWCHWAQSPRALPGPNALVFSPFFHADADRVVLQLSTGRLRLVDARDGRTRFESPAAKRPWRSDPIAIDERLVVYPDESAVVGFDLESRKARWRCAIRGPSNLIGVQLRLLHGRLLVGIERNQGMEIDALDPLWGERLWREAANVGLETIDLGDLDDNPSNLYVPVQDRILKLDAGTGKRLQTLFIGAGLYGHWRLICGKERLFAVAKQAISNQKIDLDNEWTKALYLPTWPRLERALSKSHAALMDRRLPLYAFNLKTGERGEPVAFPAAGMLADVRRAKDGVTVTTGAGIWGLADDAGK
jgi:outer membrane protein assembly factor BamB